MLRNVLGRCALFALCLFLVVCVVTPPAHDTAPCPGLAQAVGGQVEPSPCVPYGSQFALRVTAATHGQLRSIVLRGPGGLVGGTIGPCGWTGRAAWCSIPPTTQGHAWDQDSTSRGSKTRAAPARRHNCSFGSVGRSMLQFQRRRRRDRTRPPRRGRLPPRPSSRRARPHRRRSPPPRACAASATGIAMASVTPTAVVSATTIAKASTTPTAAATIPAVAPSATPTAPLPVPHDDLIEIVEVAADLPDDDVVVEYLIVRNSRSAAVSMTGWSLGDTAGRRVRLPAFTIEGEAYMWIWTGAGEADETNVYLGLRTAIWDSTGGTALLLDNQGDEVARLTY